MNFDMAAVGRLIELLQSEGQLVVHTLKDKGAKRFERPIVVAAFLLFGSYYLVYLPPVRKAQVLQQRIDEAKDLSQYVGAYKDLISKLQAIYAELPKPGDRNGFLVEAILESLKAEGLTSDSIRPPDESPEAGLIFQKCNISAEVPFTELVSWLARLEASKPFIHVFSLEVNKSKKIGFCTINVGLSTIVPTGTPGT